MSSTETAEILGGSEHPLGKDYCPETTPTSADKDGPERQEEHCRTMQVEQKQSKRKRTPCFKCGKRVQKLTQHLRGVHKMSKQQADSEVRKRIATKRKRQRSMCTMCQGVVMYPMNHLRHKHDMPTSKAVLVRTCYDPHLPVAAQTESNQSDVHTSILDTDPEVPQPTTTTRLGKKNEQHRPRRHDGPGGSHTSGLDTNPEVPQPTTTTTTRSRKKDENPRPVQYGSPDLQLKYFAEWMCGPTGYGYHNKQANQHVRQVKRVWDATGHGDITAFEATVIEEWLTREWSVMIPGTLSSYLGSVKRFIQFSEFTGHIADSKNVMGVLERAEKIVRKRRKVRESETRLKDWREILPKESRDCFCQSKHVQDIYKRAMDPTEVEDDSILMEEMRDCVMVDIALFNGCRPSVLMNMTTDDVLANSRQEVEGEQLRVISVAKHKTALSHGPANVVVTLDQLKNLKILIHMVEDLQEKRKQKYVFDRTSQILQRTTSWVNKRVKRAWALSGCMDKYGPFSFTKNRKSITTLMRDADPTLADDVAQQLCHRRETADRYYNLEDKVKKSAMIVHRIRKHFSALTSKTYLRPPQRSSTKSEKTSQTSDTTLEKKRKRTESVSDKDISPPPTYRTRGKRRYKYSKLLDH